MGAEQLVEEYGPAWSPGPFERGTDGPHVVLAGVDGSPAASRAGAYAAGLARRQRSRLVVVYVLAPAAWTGMATGYLAAAQEEAYEATIEEMRKPIRALADEARMPITFIVRRGDAFAELRRAAVELHADLVVVGASESRGHRIVGSVANRLVRAGLWPVTVVP
ncbi:universal stress protein [Amycolatopsis thermophila]|uniref:Nucleotide-binding universal stress UspA family protein n=1 Tax=Amycolatopsis thermophila TaxID=206084 RepID=A0ABU0F0G4_9PSEU|nr:universal stress protein [Amycolatopsis thermophila]MDQ0380557.1 nucleotide-binding universal stress UspA family protein [Amycolatopsis thermophila]